ncbi:MAG: glycosyltransferase family 2 protein [Cyclobacteriaceae bacterium]|nr:glycosyltransferase family 2 protein [Cyclobacteriaceae bacterium HetDA_MAG_MS6]
MSQKVTAIIPTFNEAENVAKALESVQWADEVLVIDSFSSDETLEIAKRFNARVLQHEYKYSAAQKNWAIPQASHEWVFLLDADEVAPVELAKEIKDLIANADKSAYWIGRDNFYMGKPIKFSGWQGDKVIRLFQRDCCRYEDKHVHAEVITQGEVGELHAKITHHTYKSFAHILQKIDRYTTWGAYDRVSKTKKITLFHLWVKPTYRFFKYYILKLGFLDGKVGFIIAFLSAYVVFIRAVKLDRIQSGEKFEE